jgi:hypothetical protein
VRLSVLLIRQNIVMHEITQSYIQGILCCSPCPTQAKFSFFPTSLCLHPNLPEGSASLCPYAALPGTVHTYLYVISYLVLAGVYRHVRIRTSDSIYHCPPASFNSGKHDPSSMFFTRVYRESRPRTGTGARTDLHS